MTLTKYRVMVEISENGETVTDSYVMDNLRDVYRAKAEEITALRGILPEGEAVKLGRAFRSIWEQAKKGLIGQGDSTSLMIKTNSGPMFYYFTIPSEDKKHTPMQWFSNYPFGPLEEDAESIFPESNCTILL